METEMTTFVLILTMWSADSKFMMMVPGFTSQQGCEIAAKQWMDQNGIGGYYHHNTAICAALR
jgi:hypothetical protein